MRANPNETLGTRVQDFVPSHSTVIVTVAPTSSLDRADMEHEIRVALSDLLQIEPAPASWITLRSEEGTALVIRNTYPAAVAAVTAALQRVVNRYGLSAGWVFGPSFTVLPNGKEG